MGLRGRINLSRVNLLRLLKWRLAPFLVFAIFVTAISYKVTPNHGILITGDYPYYWPDRAFDSASVIQSSFLGHIRLVGMSSFLVIVAPRILTWLFSDSWTSYLLNYGLVYITCLTYYFVAFKLTKSASSAYLAGFLIILNNAVLEYLVIQPTHIFVGLIVYALTFLLFVSAGKRFGWRHVLVSGLMSLLLTHPFLWIIQICLLVVLFIHLLAQNGRRILGIGVSTLGLMALLASYWLLPLGLALLSSSTENIYSGGQAGLFEGVRTKVHYFQAFGLFQYPGEWQNKIFGGRPPYLLYFAAVALVALVLFLFGKARNRRLLLLLVSLYVIALNIGLGPNSVVTGKVWKALYNNIPGFGFFRIFSRFLNLALMAFVLLVVYALDQVRRSNPRVHRPLVALFACSWIAGNWIFFTGDLNGTLSAARIPHEYVELNATLNATRNDYSMLTYPQVGYEAYRWNRNRNRTLFQQTVYWKEHFLERPVIFNRHALQNLNLATDFLPRLLAYHDAFTFYPTLDADVGKLDVKYVLVQKDLLDITKVLNRSGLSNRDTRKLEFVPYKRYIDYFSANPHYRLADNNKVFALFENRSFRPRIRASGAFFKKINDSTYRVFFTGIKEETRLQLLQRFDRQWKLYPQRNPSRNWCRELTTYSEELTECELTKPKHRLTSLKYLIAPSLEVPHGLALGYANEWVITSDALRQQFPNDFYKTNSDGSIDIELLVYFRPQSTFYLGVLITTLFAVGTIVMLAYALWRRRH